MHIDNAIDTVVVFLQRHELADRAEIVAEMEIAGRLDAGEYERLEFGHVVLKRLVEGPGELALDPWCSAGLMHGGQAGIKRMA
jgi:hypothetical protein